MFALKSSKPPWWTTPRHRHFATVKPPNPSNRDRVYPSCWPRTTKTSSPTCSSPRHLTTSGSVPDLTSLHPVSSGAMGISLSTQIGQTATHGRLMILIVVWISDLQTLNLRHYGDQVVFYVIKLILIVRTIYLTGLTHLAKEVTSLLVNVNLVWRWTKWLRNSSSYGKSPFRLDSFMWNIPLTSLQTFYGQRWLGAMLRTTMLVKTPTKFGFLLILIFLRGGRRQLFSSPGRKCCCMGCASGCLCPPNNTC